MYIIRIDQSKIKKTHKEIFNFLLKEGIGVNLHYIPVHLHPEYQRYGFRKGDFPESEKYYSEAISLPIFPTLKKEDQIKVVEAVRGAIV